MNLFHIKDGDHTLWLAARIGEDVYTYVPNTGRFHRNTGVSEDYFMDRDLEYVDITVTQARETISQGLEPLDEDAMSHHLAQWRSDPHALTPDEVFAVAVADQN